MSNFIKQPDSIRIPRMLEIVQWPDPILNTKSSLILNDIVDNKDLQDLLDDMVATMTAYKAVGLAAIQVGVPVRALVVTDSNGSTPIKVINPVLKSENGRVYTHEGCLSFPGLFVKVARPESVVVQYFDENGELKETNSTGLLGRAIQHEMDHLDGKTYLDKLNRFERSRALNKFKIIKRKIKKLYE